MFEEYWYRYKTQCDEKKLTKGDYKDEFVARMKWLVDISEREA